MPKGQVVDEKPEAIVPEHAWGLDHKLAVLRSLEADADRAIGACETEFANRDSPRQGKAEGMRRGVADGDESGVARVNPVVIQPCVEQRADTDACLQARGLDSEFLVRVLKSKAQILVGRKTS